MKRNKIAIAICASFLIPVISTNATVYKSIVHKNPYEYKAATLIPGNETSIQTTAENVDTNQSVSNDITKSILTLQVENGHLIEISTDVINVISDGRTLEGRWISNRPVSFLSNDKNSAIFYAPSYDGSYSLNLELSDGLYTKVHNAVNIQSEVWTNGTTVFGDWGIYNVDQDWSPDLSLSYENELIEQTKISDLSRTKQEKEIRPKTGETRNLGAETIENNDNNVETRNEYGTIEFWTTTDSVVLNDWGFGEVLVDWNPISSNRYENETISQTREIQNERTMQDKEIRPKTNAIRNDGAPYIETAPLVENRDVQGDLEYWISTDPKTITPWAITETFVNWTPDASGVYETETVSQYREVKKERTIQNQEIRPKTSALRTVGATINDTTVTTEYRDVQGQLEYWENSGVSNCTAWSLDRYDVWLPDAAGVDRSETVEQTRVKYENRSCTGEQVRPVTGETRNASSEIEYRSETETQIVDGTKIDLNDWSTIDTSGEWSVSTDGSYAYQAINGAPTVFESKASNFGSTTITGKMRVRAAAGDNDWIGIALGRIDSNNYHLWSWKNGGNAGSTEKEGHNFAKVTNNGAINWAMDISKTGYQVLDIEHGLEFGWEHGIYYNFEITYTPTNVKIYVDGLKVIDVNGTFPDGKIGFFNYSQGQVEYYKVTDTPLN